MGLAFAALAAVVVLLVVAAVVTAVERRLTPAREPGIASSYGSARNGPIDPWLYHAAPVIALLAVAWAAVVIPLGPGLIAADLGIGLFYFIVVVDFMVLAIALAGWGANTAGAVESCYRAVAQLVAYVIPLGLAIIGPIMMARSMSTVDIANAQEAAGLWYVVPQPLGFVLYLACALMQSYRSPFAEPFSKCVGGGVLGSVDGARRLLWRIALGALLVVVAAMGAVLFLGGYAGPWLPGPLWMIIKTAAIVAVLVAIGRRARPRSTAEMLGLSWKVLIPVGLVNVLLVGALILLGVGQGPFG